MLVLEAIPLFLCNLQLHLTVGGVRIKLHRCTSSLTNYGVRVSIVQLCDGHEVTVHGGDALTVIAGRDGGMSMKRHLVVILQCGVLFVGHLQRGLGDVIHLRKMGITSGKFNLMGKKKNHFL